MGESDNWTILVLDIVFKGIMRVCECVSVTISPAPDEKHQKRGRNIV